MIREHLPNSPTQRRQSLLTESGDGDGSAGPALPHDLPLAVHGPHPFGHVAVVLALILLPAVVDAQAERVGLHLLHLDAPKPAALPVGCSGLHGAVSVQPHDVAAAVLPVHQLPDDGEAAERPARRPDAAGKVQIVALQDDAGVAGHLHRDAALWGEGESAMLGLSGLHCALPTDVTGERGMSVPLFRHRGPGRMHAL